MSTDTPPFEDDHLAEYEIEVKQGRGFPYATFGEWVMLADIPSQSKLLYALLRMHVNRKRGDSRVWPKQTSLAPMMGLKKATDVGKYAQPLIEIGAIDVEEFRYGGGLRRRYAYTVHEAPPRGYDGLSSLAEYYLDKAESESKSPAQPDIPKKGGPDLRKKGGRDLPSKGSHKPDELPNHTNKNRRSGVAPSRRRRSTGTPGTSRGSRPAGTDDGLAGARESELATVHWTKAAAGVLAEAKPVWRNLSPGCLVILGTDVEDLITAGIPATAQATRLRTALVGTSPTDLTQPMGWIRHHLVGTDPAPCGTAGCMRGWIERGPADATSALVCPECSRIRWARATQAAETAQARETAALANLLAAELATDPAPTGAVDQDHSQESPAVPAARGTTDEGTGASLVRAALATARSTR